MPTNLPSKLQNILHRLKSSNFVRDVLLVGGGIAVAQVISLTFMPFLTRLYGPESFGIAASFAAILNIITPISTMGYANAIVMPETDEDASAVARLSISIAFTLIPISLLAVFLGKPWLAQWTGMQKSPNMLYLIPISLIVTAFLSVANQSAIRAQLFKPKARAYVESTLLTNINKLIGGFLAPSGTMLIILTILGSLTNFIFQILRVPRQGALKPSNWFGIRGALRAAKIQKEFSLFRMPQSVIRAISMGLPVILLTSLFGASYAGQYSLVVLILSAPVVLLGDAVGEVFYPKITRAITNNSVQAFELISKATLTLFLVGIAPFGFIILFGDIFLPLIFGDKWQIAGVYSQWVAFWMIAMLTVRPAIAAMPVLKIQHILLIYEITITIARIGALYIGSFYKDDTLAIALFSIVNVIGYLLLFIIIMLKSKKRVEYAENS